MICIILVAGHATVLESEIKMSPKYCHLAGVPKALLPGVGGKRILDYWWEAIKTRQLFSEVYLVTNADKYKHFERWATASDFPVENIVNDGSTLMENRLGAVADLELVIRMKHVQDDILVVAGDMLFQDDKFDMSQVINYFRVKKDGDLAIYYTMEPSERTASRGIVELEQDSSRIVNFYEKPETGETSSRLASVVFYCLRRQTLPTITSYLDNWPDAAHRNFGLYMKWLIESERSKVYGMKLPTGFQLIGQVGLKDYELWLKLFAERVAAERHNHAICRRAYARVGLMGNPSDGYYGKTIAMSISNFWAEVTITESEHLVLVPHPLNDPTEFGSLADLHGISQKEGYLGGLRLLQATCKKFYQYCSQKGIALAKRNFTLKYDTNIPRQVGLAGSSAIVTATLKCLMDFFNLNENDMPKVSQPNFVLEVEMQELFITAGLQDRVAQVYEGLVYMDFDRDLMERRGYGDYMNLDMAGLPMFWLAYVADPSDSGKIHSDVRQRWESGDQDVISDMKTFAQFTDNARTAIENKDWEQVAKLMDENFNLRRQLFGDDVVGNSMLHAVEIARQHQSAVKFPGSGGAVVGLQLDTSKMAALKTALQREGYVVVEIIPYSGQS